MFLFEGIQSELKKQGLHRDFSDYDDGDDEDDVDSRDFQINSHTDFNVDGINEESQ